jgi:hypothetical protein
MLPLVIAFCKIIESACFNGPVAGRYAYEMAFAWATATIADEYELAVVMQVFKSKLSTQALAGF